MFVPRRLNTYPSGKSGTALPDFANLRSLRASVTPMSTKHPLHGTAQANPSQYDSNTQERAAAEFLDAEHPRSYRPSIERAPDDPLSYQVSSGSEQSFDLEEQHRRQAALTRLTQHQYEQYEEPAAVNDNAHVRGRDWLALGVSFGDYRCRRCGVFRYPVLGGRLCGAGAKYAGDSGCARNRHSRQGSIVA
jgi:hypothetical protein